MKISFWRSVHRLIYALRTYHDEDEHLICDAGHELGQAGWEMEECPTCGADIRVKVPRRVAIELAMIDIRRSVLPWHTTEFSTSKDSVEHKTYWRGKIVRRRQVPNQMKMEN